MEKIGTFILGSIILCFLYMVIGTGERIDEIKTRAPQEIKERNWEILRYEGWQYGSFFNHGGKVWYHVRNTDDHDIQYRVYVTLWGGELHYYYKQPEILERNNVKVNFNKE
jgi:hypothetical protein